MHLRSPPPVSPSFLRKWSLFTGRLQKDLSLLSELQLSDFHLGVYTFREHVLIDHQLITWSIGSGTEGWVI